MIDWLADPLTIALGVLCFLTALAALSSDAEVRRLRKELEQADADD